MVDYVPERGDIVWLEFDPQKGKEIQKKRPALVISPKKYNQKTGLALFMPMTSHVKGYPFECLVECGPFKGALLCDQIRSLDWKARKASYAAALPTQFWTEIMGKLSLLFP